jgi:hypothetical protein
MPAPAATALARGLLAARDPAALRHWVATARPAWRDLQKLLFDPDELVRWRAVEALGLAAAALARRDLERVRERLRRTFWLMNDESGGLLSFGPQVIGAALANVPALASDFGELLASYLDEEPFELGTRWALWRAAPAVPDDVAARLRASWTDPDPAIRGHAALAWRALRPDAAAAAAAALAGDDARCLVFDYRALALREATVATLAGGRF